MALMIAFAAVAVTCFAAGLLVGHKNPKTADEVDAWATKLKGAIARKAATRS